MVKSWETVQVRTEVKEELQKIFLTDKKRPENQKFNAWLDNMLQSYIEFNGNLKIYGYFMEFNHAEDKRIDLFDHILNEPVSVYLDGRNKTMTCTKDKMDNCVHVGFCFAIPETYNVLIKHGFKQPNLDINATFDGESFPQSAVS